MSENEETSEQVLLVDMEPSADPGKKVPDCVHQLALQWNETSAAEAKIRLCLEAMRQALSKEGAPCFRDFWGIRQVCLTFFKEPISPKLRSQLWGLYVELSAESKRLKEILNEQSAFAAEQIELAIQALERDVEQQDVLLAQMPDVLSGLDNLAMKEKSDAYGALQKQIHLLSGYAARINALRKEVLKTEMRIRQKNKFLSRLSLCGDRVFPKRKEFIQQISSLFMEDVNRFTAHHFHEDELSKLPSYLLREEVKQLQLAAKSLTLGSQTFTEARLLLSRCWDQMKEQEKERKGQIQQKRQLFKQNFDLVMEKIKPFQELCQNRGWDAECEAQAAEIAQLMRGLELGREEVVTLKNALSEAKKGPLERAQQEELQRRQIKQEQETRQREAAKQFKVEVEAVLQQAPEWECAALAEKVHELAAASERVIQTKTEKQLIDRLLKNIRDVLHEKKTQALLSLPEEDLQRLDQLKGAFEEHQQRRQELKRQLESYRKLLGGSGLDFEKAMLYRDLIESEKAALEKVESTMGEIREKIDEIES